MSEPDRYLEASVLFIPPTPSRYVCHIYMALSISTLSVLPSVSHRGIIQRAVNEFFNSPFSVDTIQTLPNILAVSLFCCS
jgi:hypothetical protein